MDLESCICFDTVLHHPCHNKVLLVEELRVGYFVIDFKALKVISGGNLHKVMQSWRHFNILSEVYQCIQFMK